MTENVSTSSCVSKTNGNHEKPRARLGSTQVVTLPASDSEHEDDESFVEIHGESEDEGDFLASHPDDTEVILFLFDPVYLLMRVNPKDLQLQHLRLKSVSLPTLRLERFSKYLKRLCLRQNELVSPLPCEALRGLTELDQLDLYDNRLGPRVTEDELSGCPNLTCVTPL